MLNRAVPGVALLLLTLAATLFFLRSAHAGRVYPAVFVAAYLVNSLAAIVTFPAAGPAIVAFEPISQSDPSVSLKRSENSNPVSTARRTGHDATTFLSRTSCSSVT